jgi:hypothetical protein
MRRTYLTHIAMKLRGAIYLVMDAKALAEQASDHDESAALHTLTRSMTDRLRVVELKRDEGQIPPGRGSR